MTLNYAVVKIILARTNDWVVKPYDKLPVDAYENVIAVFAREIDAKAYVQLLNKGID